jgi:hypothetical protein
LPQPVPPLDYGRLLHQEFKLLKVIKRFEVSPRLLDDHRGHPGSTSTLVHLFGVLNHIHYLALVHDAIHHVVLAIPVKVQARVFLQLDAADLGVLDDVLTQPFLHLGDQHRNLTPHVDVLTLERRKILRVLLHYAALDQECGIFTPVVL